MTGKTVTSPLLRFADVSAGYGDEAVFQRLSFALSPGEAICFTGPNGSGKSTILRAVVRLSAILSGAIEYQGVDVGRIPKSGFARGGVAYVTQTRGLFPTLTVEENLRTAALGIGKVLSKTAAQELLGRFELSPTLLTRKAGVLSGGERTIVALARALTLKPDLRLLLLDEASAGLSIVKEATLQKLLRALRSEGVALLMAEQNIEFARSLDLAIHSVPSVNRATKIDEVTA